MADSQPVALITGTSRGLGLSLAHKMLGAGYTVVGASRGPTPIDDPGFSSHQVDLADAEACARVVPDVVANHGRIDLLINNAATQVYRNCWEVDSQELALQLRVNLTAPFVLSRDAARQWLSDGTPGVIVNVCSIESEVAWRDPPQSAYATTKGGLVGLTRAFANDLAANGIRVNGVAPGVIDTGMAPTSGPDPAQSIPQGRLAQPSEIAEVIAFVASGAASYMTGEIVYADGGYRLP